MNASRPNVIVKLTPSPVKQPPKKKPKKTAEAQTQTQTYGSNNLGQKWLSPRAFIKVNDSVEFLKKFKAQIDPNELNVTLTTLKDIDDNTILVGTSTEHQLYEYCKEVRIKFKVDIIPAVIHDPVIIVYNTGSLTERQITKAIETITSEPIIKIESEHKTLTNVYVTISDLAYYELQDESPYEINFGRVKCFYEQLMPIPMCDTCSLFGHTALRCESGGEEALAFKTYMEQQISGASTSKNKH